MNESAPRSSIADKPVEWVPDAAGAATAEGNVVAWRNGVAGAAYREDAVSVAEQPASTPEAQPQPVEAQ